jgi:lipid II:glycine glycyltransferase (peptidoglycan interpeptide bridge formation enzyme)
MAATMGEACQVGLATLDGTPVASIIVLRGKNANYSRGAMDSDRIGNSGANDLLQKLAIEDAARSGCRYYHMGESARSSSLSQFKEKFGAVAYDYAEYRLERLPLTQIDQAARTAVKRLIGFKDGG